MPSRSQSTAVAALAVALASVAWAGGRGTTLVSVDRGGTASGDGPSGECGIFGYVPTITPSGRFVAFESCATDLVAADTNGAVDVFVRDLKRGATMLVSANRAGTDTGNGGSTGHSLSADGRLVAFTSDATDLVATDGNGTTDVFVRDLAAGTTRLVSVRMDGADSGNDTSRAPVISADGRVVAFLSRASDLVAEDTRGGATNVYVRDLATGTTRLASVDVAGAAGGDGDGGNVLLSADGRFVAFDSRAGNLVRNDGNGAADVFVRDMKMGRTTLVTVTRTGTSDDHGVARLDDLSPNGRYVAFESNAGDLVKTPTNGVFNVFVRDVARATTSLVSIDAAGTGGSDGSAGNGKITPNGRFVAFGASATNLVPGGTSGVGDVFVRDRRKGITTLVSVNPAGTGSGDDFSAGPFISDDGRYVVFKSDAGDLVGDDTNGESDTFVRDLHERTTRALTVDLGGVPVGGDYEPYVMSANGRMVAFESDASTLVTDDTNTFCDVFARPTH